MNSSRIGGFVGLDEAVRQFQPVHSFHLYPNMEDWKGYLIDAELSDWFREVSKTESILSIVGRPGFGKTFASLWLGHQWRETRIGLLRKEHNAYYAVTGAVDLESIRQQWALRAIRGATNLWILDQANDDLDLAARLARMFESQQLGTSNHRFLLTAWSPLKSVAPTATFNVRLREPLVRASLGAAELPLPSPDVVAELVRRKNVGLKRILYRAKFDPSSLADVETVRSRWDVDERFSRLTAKANSLALELALARFLGLKRPEGPGEDERLAFHELEEAGIAHVKHASWVLYDDEDAFSILQKDIQSGDLAGTFGTVLASMALTFPSIAAPILRAARHRRVSDLPVTLSSSFHRHLVLDKFFLGALADRLPELLADSQFPLSDLRDFLPPGSNHLASVARTVLRRRRREFEDKLREGDPEAWGTAVVLQRASGSDEFAALLEASLVSEAFADRLASLPTARRSRLVTIIRSFNQGAARSIALASATTLEAAIEATSARPPRGFWHYFRKRLTRLAPEVAAEVLATFDSKRLGFNICRDPRHARDELLPVMRRHRVARFAVRRALLVHPLSGEDVASWRAARNIVGYLEVADVAGAHGCAGSAALDLAVRRLVPEASPGVVVELLRCLGRISDWKVQASLAASVLASEPVDGWSPVTIGRLLSFVSTDHAKSTLRARFDGLVETSLSQGSHEVVFVLVHSLLAVGPRELQSLVLRSGLNHWRPPPNLTRSEDVALAGWLDRIAPEVTFPTPAYGDGGRRDGLPPAIVVGELLAAASPTLSATCDRRCPPALARYLAGGDHRFIAFLLAVPNPREIILLAEFAGRALSALVASDHAPELRSEMQKLGSSEMDGAWAGALVFRLVLLSAIDGEAACELIRRSAKQLTGIVWSHPSAETILRVIWCCTAISSQFSGIDDLVKRLREIALKRTVPTRFRKEVATFLADSGSIPKNEDLPTYSDPLTQVLVQLARGTAPDAAAVDDVYQRLAGVELRFLLQRLQRLGRS